MRAPEIKWKSLVQLSYDRERESDAIERAAEFGTDDIFVLPEEMDKLHCEVAQEMLREVAPQDLEDVGSAAMATLAGAPEFEYPLNAVGWVDARIQINSGDTEFLPAREVSAAMWYMMKGLTAIESNRFAFIGGKVYFKGNAIEITFLLEPSLATFKFDSPVLPAGLAEERVDRVHQLILAVDRIPDQA